MQEKPPFNSYFDFSFLTHMYSLIAFASRLKTIDRLAFEVS